MALDAAQDRLMEKLCGIPLPLETCNLMMEWACRRKREWDDFGQEYTIGPDGFTSLFTAIQSKAGLLKEEGHEKMSYEGKVEKVEVPEV